MTYTSDTGPVDVNGRVIKEGDRIVVGSNSGLRFGVVDRIAVYEHQDYRTKAIVGYSYGIKVTKDDGRRQTFPHNTMGESKFAVLT